MTRPAPSSASGIRHLASRILIGDARESLDALPANIIHVIIGSIPYLWLRAYAGLKPLIWGGDPKCRHKWQSCGGRKGSESGYGYSSGLTHGDKPRLDLADWGTKGNQAKAGHECPRCGAWKGHWGQEDTVERYLANTVEFMRAVRRVLRPDGTLWLNLGDTYGGSWGAHKDHHEPPHSITKQHDLPNTSGKGWSPKARMADGQPLNIPHRVAMALQADGWRLRSVIVWAKAVELAPDWNGSAMPESPRGWRWERHKIKVKAGGRSRSQGQGLGQEGRNPDSSRVPELVAQWLPCPGCPKCLPAGGFVLRRGQWRPTRSHEYLFLFAKSPLYFADDEAVRTLGGLLPASVERYAYPLRSGAHGNGEETQKATERRVGGGGTRNPRAVWYWPPDPRDLAGWTDTWCVGVEPFKGKHYAAFPRKLVSLCIRASTPEHGVCPKCGAPWGRVSDTAYQSIGAGDTRGEKRCNVTKTPGMNQGPAGMAYGRAERDSRTIGWLPTCECYGEAIAPVECLAPAGDVGAMQAACERHLPPVPATVLDPCGGSGTTAVEAEALGRDWILCEASPEYAKMAAERLAESRQPKPAKARRKRTSKGI